MEVQNSRKIDLINKVLLYAAPIAGASIFCLFHKGDAIGVLSNFVITLILAGIYYTLLHVNQDYLYGKIGSPLIYFGSFFLSFVLLGGRAGLPLGVFWMLAVVVAAMDSGIEMALATHAVLMVEYAVLLFPLNKSFYEFSGYILLGVVVALLFSQLQDKKAVPYLALILVACDGVLQCVVYQFDLVRISKYFVEIAVEIVSLLAFVGIGYIYLIKAGKMLSEEPEENVAEAVEKPEENVAEKVIVAAAAITETETMQKLGAEIQQNAEVQQIEVEEKGSVGKQEEEAQTTFAEEQEEEAQTAFAEEQEEEAQTTFAGKQEEEAQTAFAEELERKEEQPDAGQMDSVTLLQKLTEPGFELLERLKAYSDSLHMHSERIAVLSEKAAQAIGGNAALAKAGGFYHELGRIENGENYIEAGTRIGQEYDFPEELLAVMRQHSTGFELPKSAEAAVVMISDCIISTSDFLAKSGKREKISDRQLVTSIFQNRLEKGNLDQSGMTEEQIQILKDFYIENTFAGEQ